MQRIERTCKPIGIIDTGRRGVYRDRGCRRVTGSRILDAIEASSGPGARYRACGRDMTTAMPKVLTTSPSVRCFAVADRTRRLSCTRGSRARASLPRHLFPDAGGRPGPHRDSRCLEGIREQVGGQELHKASHCSSQSLTSSEKLGSKVSRAGWLDRCTLNFSLRAAGLW